MATTRKRLPHVDPEDQPLSLIETRFVSEYLIDLNGMQAYLRVRNHTVKEESAKVEASRLLTRPNVQRALAAAKREQLKRADLTAVRTLEELRRIAFFNPKTLFTVAGRLKAIHTLEDDIAACIASSEHAQANFDRTDGRRSSEWLHKVKYWDKLKALELLVKHFKIDGSTDHESGQDWDKYLAAVNRARQKLVADKAKKGR